MPLLAWLFLAAQILVSQSTPPLQVTGAVKQSLSLTTADLAKMPRATVETKFHNTAVTYEGVWLHTILKRAGVPQGEELRGKALAAYVLATAIDGYQVVFSIGELDPSLGGAQALLADTADGKPLSPADAPFRLVLASDKRAARSIRMLLKLELIQIGKMK